MDFLSGLVLSTCITVFIFTSDILLIQYSQTPAVMCVAGVLLMSNAYIWEKREKYKKIQITCSFGFIIFASLLRFISFFVCAFFCLIFLVCLFFSEYSNIQKNESIKKRFSMAFKKNASLILSIVVAFLSSFVLFGISETINNLDNNYHNYVQYNNARMRIDDYQILNYEENEAFYNSLGFSSKAELELFSLDKEKYNSETLNAIADYSTSIIQKQDSKYVYVIKKYINILYWKIMDLCSEILSIKNKLHINIDNKTFILLFFLLVIVMIVILYYVIYKHAKYKKKKTPIIVLYYLTIVLIWLVYFLLVGGIFQNNFLFISLLLIVFIALLFGKADYYLAVLLFSVIPIGLYLFQSSFRIRYRVVFVFLFPSIIFLLYLISSPNIKLINKKVLYAVRLIMISIVFFIPSVVVYYSFYSECKRDVSMDLRQYFENNENRIFVTWIPTNACIDKGYFNALLVPDIPENEIGLGWSNSSNFFVNDLEKKHISNIMPELIDSDSRLVIAISDTKNQTKCKKTYEDFFNFHYFNGRERVNLELENKFNYSLQFNNPELNIKEVCVYKVITKE